MNKERLLELADLLETEKVAKHFDMNDYFRTKDQRTYTDEPLGAVLDECGAVACIAGWAIAHFEPKRYVSYSMVDEVAKDILGIKGYAGDLFCPAGIPPGRWSEVSPTDAAQTIRSYVETGVVDWSWHPAYEGEIEDDED
jgi:hypothetical protein